MALTLEQAKQLSQDKLTNEIYDEFLKSPLMASLPFDNTVKPQGGKTLAYVYNRVTTQPTAGTRAINGEYTSQETLTTQKVVNLKVMGGSYSIDRVIANDETQVTNEVEFQSLQKTKATQAVFNDLIINGNSATKADEFDGIDKAIVGTTTEVTPATAIDLSTADAITTNYKQFLYLLRQLGKNMDGAPTHLLMNNDAYAVFQSVADLVPNITFTRDELGNEIGYYGSAQLVKMGDKAGTNTPIIANGTDGTTSIYAVRVALDGLHGISPDGTQLIKTYLPDFTTAGAVKEGEVEFVGAIAVKNSKSVGAIRKIKVVATP